MRLRIRHRQPTSAAQRALGRWLPRTMTAIAPRTDARIALLETLAVMSLAVALSAWLRPLDPLWTGSGFPWLWLVAAVMALRYGSAHALVAMALALAAWLMLDTWRAPLGEFPRLSFIGGLVLALVGGEFADRWRARLANAEAVNAYLDERLHALTQHHFLLSVSHDRLEQELLVRPFTLRETLFALRQQLNQGGIQGGPLPNAAWLLQLLAQSCRLDAAALFAIDGQQLDPRPAAALGDFGAAFSGASTESGSGDLRGAFGAGAPGALLDTADPMLAGALEAGQLMHLQNEPFVETDRPSRYVVCAPIVGSSGRALGVLVVERMAFTALTLETLQLLQVLLAYYGDSIDYGSGTAPLLQAYPRCPPDFALEAVRLQRLQTTAFIRSSLVAFVLPPDATSAELWTTRLQQVQRGLDVAWTHVDGRTRVHLVLLPITDDVGLTGYLDRVDRTLRDKFDVALAPTVTVRTHALDEDDLVDQLRELLSAPAAAP